MCGFRGGGFLRTSRSAQRILAVLFLGVILTQVPAVTTFAAPTAPATSEALPVPVPCNNAAGSCWTPPVRARWQYQLQGSPAKHSAVHGGCLYRRTGFINVGVTGTSFATGDAVAPDVFDIDILQDGKCYSPQNYSVLNYAAVRGIHAKGARVIGYIDAGTAETWRPDYPQLESFNRSCNGCLFGNPLSQYRDEFWLNIATDATGVNPRTGQVEPARQFLLGVMRARLKRARKVGADAIEFDDVDSWQNDTGLTISPQAQLRYNSRLANLAHRMGFAVGLKNDLSQASTLQPYFDFAINEQCWQYQECAALQSWPAKYKKAVFNVEYKLQTSKFCEMANSPKFDFNSIRKTANLYDLPYQPCR
jgi:glycosyl hydrolase family 114